MFRSMMVPPWGGAKASYWLIPAPPLAGTLQTGYPRVQDSSQDKERNVQPRTATCLATSEHASQPRWDPRLPHVQWLRSPPPEREGSGATMCTIASDPLGELRCATCPEASDPASLRGGLRDPVMPVIPYGPHASNMKKSLAGLPVQQGSLVPNAHVHVSRHLTSRPSCACKTCG
jgi:hypothetical protein